MPAVLLDAIRVPGHEGSILGQTADFYEGPKVVSVRLPKRFEKGARRVLQGLYSSIRVLLSSGREGGRERKRERERDRGEKGERFGSFRKSNSPIWTLPKRILPR